MEYGIPVDSCVEALGMDYCCWCTRMAAAAEEDAVPADRAAALGNISAVADIAGATTSANSGD